MNRSRIVAWLRILLPLAALAILSTLFLLGQSPDPESGAPYADVDLEGLASDPRMTAPEFAGVTDGGASITLRADRASPDPTRDGSASGMRLTWRAADGLAADLTAPHVQIEGDLIALSGGVRMTTSDGWAITAPQFEARPTSDQITAETDLRGFAPMGEWRAGRMIWAPDDKGDNLLNLSDGVQLIYRP